VANKKTVISRINSIGAMRQNITGVQVNDKISGRALKKAYCSIDNDSITTYVQKKEWVISLNDYLFPPYVECEYVV
jgi:hypothetical protein